MAWQQQQQHLDSLQGMVNAVLIETGKALRSANAKGPKTIGHTHGRLKAFLPTALDKFHLALDELETDIVRAQAVMSRNLRELRARQHKLDNPSIPQTENVPPSDELATLPITDGPDAAFSKYPEEHQTKTGQDDILDTGAVKHSTGSQANQPVDKAQSTNEVVLQKEVQHSAPKAVVADRISSIAITDDLSKCLVETSQVHELTGLGIDTSGAEAPESSAASTSVDVQNTTFDSMYDIGNAPNTDPNFDDLDFNTEHENHDFGQSDAELNLSNFGNQESRDKTDIVSTLLQGLDSYSNGNDTASFNSVNMASDILNDESGGDRRAIPVTDEFNMSGGDLDIAMGIGNHESAFNDLLEGMEIEFTESGTGANGDFDDHLFDPS